MYRRELPEFFGAKVIDCYTRAQAIADGVLVAITAAYARTIAWDQDNGAMQYTEGRAWDVTRIASLVACDLVAIAGAAADFEVFAFPNVRSRRDGVLAELILHVGGERRAGRS
ncbi:hypothetical protein [Oerskovia sp. Root22]|uniref:hypothetical protein n=1 Tax=Oerskovia sp. Root22 TaxID=1736494 RepID=UPI0006FC4061|nr:hypothetical protein [Oerskovia sp. Root22]KRC43034.1 hypothetical protein ASE15_03510 [Oerskovia sp. Root22]